MNKKINFSYDKKKLRRFPKIQGSNINLSINNTYVVIKNQTPENYSYIQKDILPNIFSYNIKKKEQVFSPIKKIKTKITSNIHNINLVRKKNILNEKNEKKYPEDFILTTKILNRMLWFFNIRELLILMNVNKKINNFIKKTLVFQKYINIKNDLKNGNLFSNLNKNNIYPNIKNIKNNILKTSNNIKIEINIESNDTSNKNINAFFKYNLLNKKKLKLKKVLNPDILELSQTSSNKNSNINNIKKFEKKISNIQMKNSIYSNNNIIDSLNNTLISYKTGLSKNENTEKEKISKIDDNSSYTDILNFNKFRMNIISLLKDNGNKMLLLMKKYKLNSNEAKVIFKGIIESYLLKKQSYEKEKSKNYFSSLVLQNIKADKYFSYYIDPLLNLEFEDIIKIHFENIIISSINIMKKISYLLSRNFTSIKILLLQNNNIDDNCGKILFKNLKYNKSLTILNLSHNKISNISIINGELFFKYNNSLNTLVLTHNYLGTNGSYNLMNYLKFNNNSVLRTIDISYNAISEGGIIPLVEYIKDNEKLLSLFLAGNCIYDKGFNLFIESLLSYDKNVFNNIKLSYLDISNNYLTKNSCKNVNNLITLSPYITRINISYNSFSNEGINNIFSFINIKCKLVSLDLSQTDINEKCIKNISEKIDKNIALRILNLSYNNLGKACIYIKNLLIKETNIKILKLVSCKICKDISLVFQGLCKNNNLETLDISSNYFIMNKNVLTDIVNFFKENKKLLNLILDDTRIDDTGINFICQGIGLNHSIKKLSLKNNFITEEYIDLLIDNIKNNKIIRKIELEGNGISKKGIEYVNSILYDKLNKK